jgi:peptidoglycan/LPS O-acetylase OafA/YrhL
MSEKYRPDIDGLRAIAIVPVVLFHADLPGFGGGFIGVDVFYVISGYLITRIIVDEIDETGSFSFIKFYERRVRRLFPALAVMMAVTSVIAFFVLLPVALENYGKSAVAASLFSANFFFWKTSGYFGPAADRLPLLHTWSLAVEEQFYLLFPPFLIFVTRWSKKAVVPAIVIGAVLSLAANVLATSHHPFDTFYLPQYRAWELDLGALITLGVFPSVTNAVARTGLAALGLGMIAWSILFYSTATPYPGIAAVLPCAGAALLIHSGQSGPSPIRALLSLPLLVGIGLISYSLYLWHWPLIVFAKYASFYGLSLAMRLSLVTIAVVLAAISWRFVEMPIRRRNLFAARPRLFAAAAYAMTALVVFGAACTFGDGLPWRMPAEVLALDKAGHDENFDVLTCHDMMEAPIRADRLCRIGDASVPATWMVWGDSDAWALKPAIDRWMRGNGEAGWISSRGGCPPFLGVVRPNWEPCKGPNDATLDFIERHKVDKVLFVAAWSGYPKLGLRDQKSQDASVEQTPRVLNDAVDTTFAALAAHNVKIYVFDSIPGAKMNVPDTLGRAVYFHQKIDVRYNIEEYHSKNRLFEDAFRRNSQYIAGHFDPAKTICATGTCEVLTAAGVPLYSDANHPSSKAAGVFVAILRDGYSPGASRDGHGDQVFVNQ